MRAKSKWEEFFDGHAPVYEENCFTKNTIAEVEFVIEALGLRPGSAVLDIGCGTGRHSIELAQRGCLVTGVDLSEGMLRQAQQHAATAGVQVRWRHANATTFEVDQHYDGVICLCEGAFGLLGAGDDALAHPLAILRRTAAALKPSAKCLFTVLNGLAMVRRHKPGEEGQAAFDPLTLTETSDCDIASVPGTAGLRERGFVPTELSLLFQTAGLEVLGIWGGTAGNWGHRPVELDEMEIMVLGCKPDA